MATIEKRGKRFRVRVRLNGVDVSESCRTMGDARAWAAQVEADIHAGKMGKTPDRSFGELVARYVAEVSPDKGGARWEANQVKRLVSSDDPILHVRLPQLGPEHFASWRDRRTALVSGATVNREWNFLSAICTRAVKEWRWLQYNPMSGVKRPASGKPRNRRVTQDEIDRILLVCGDDMTSVTSRVGAAFAFAIETAMRAGEICALKRSDIDLEKRVAYVRAEVAGARKTGTARSVPLSTEAVRIIEQLRKDDGESSVFLLASANLDALFRRAREKAMVYGLHFHDARAEALTRLSKKLDVMQLARVSGHKDIKLLHDVYYRETAEDMVRLLD